MVTVAVPVVAVVLAVNVSVEDPPLVLIDDGLNDAVTPLGRPLAESVAVSALPEVSVVLTVVVVEPPWAIEPEVGLSLTEKSLPAVRQLGRTKWPMRVCQLKLPAEARYWSVYQKVQLSDG